MEALIEPMTTKANKVNLYEGFDTDDVDTIQVEHRQCANYLQ